MSRIIIGPNARFSYANVFQVSQKSGKYETDILIHKSDTATLGKVMQAYGEVVATIAQDARFKNVHAQHPSFLHALKDGDVWKPSDATYAGHWFIKAKNVNRPEVVGPALEMLTSTSQFSSGDFGNVSIEFKVFAPSPKVPDSGYGIRAILGNIQKIRDGEKLDTGASQATATQDFQQVGAPLAPAPQQQPAQAPAWGAPAPQQQPAQAPATPQPAWPPAQAPHPYPAQAQPAAPVNPHQPQAPWPPTQAPAGQPAWGGPQTFPQ